MRVGGPGHAQTPRPARPASGGAEHASARGDLSEPPGSPPQRGRAMCHAGHPGYTGSSAGHSENSPCEYWAHTCLPSTPSIKPRLKQPPPHAVSRNGEEGKETAGSSPFSRSLRNAGPLPPPPPTLGAGNDELSLLPGAALRRAGVGTRTAGRAGRSQLRQRALQTPCLSLPAVTGRERASRRRRPPRLSLRPRERDGRRLLLGSRRPSATPSPPSAPSSPPPTTKRAGYK